MQLGDDGDRSNVEDRRGSALGGHGLKLGLGGTVVVLVLSAGKGRRLAAAAAVGDDRLQKASTGRVSPESFTHGSAEQRVRWFRRGLEKGSLRECDTFAAASP